VVFAHQQSRAVLRDLDPLEPPLRAQPLPARLQQPRANCGAELERRRNLAEELGMESPLVELGRERRNVIFASLVLVVRLVNQASIARRLEGAAVNKASKAADVWVPSAHREGICASRKRMELLRQRLWLQPLPQSLVHPTCGDRSRLCALLLPPPTEGKG